MITVTAMEAKNRFGQLLDTAQREPVAITRRGRVAAIMVSPKDMQDLLEARRNRCIAVEAFEAYFARSDGSLTHAARSLTDEDIVKLVHESR